MLVADRKEGDDVHYRDVVIHVVRVKKGRVRLVVEPKESQAENEDDTLAEDSDENE